MAQAFHMAACETQQSLHTLLGLLQLLQLPL